MAKLIFFAGLFALSLFVAMAADQSTLQDFCVAEPNSQVTQWASHSRQHKQCSGVKSNSSSHNSDSRKSLWFALYYAPWGINPPHTHPRATEILTVIEGTLEVGFITSNPDNRLIAKTLNKGDVYVFPIGLVHYQRNVGNGNAMAIAALSSQNPGVITIANAVFGSKPDIWSDVLVKAFQVDKSVVFNVQSKF